MNGGTTLFGRQRLAHSDDRAHLLLGGGEFDLRLENLFRDGQVDVADGIVRLGVHTGCAMAVRGSSQG